MTKQFSSLTPHSPGSFRELWFVSWPAILSAASGCLMAFGDRLVLSFYSQEAFNAHVGATSWYWAFNFTFTNLVSIAQVFVGQFNGEKNLGRIGPVVWQMIWASFGLWLLIVPFALWGVPHLLAPNLAQWGDPYLQILLLFLPINCAAYGALAAFFTGRGETKIVSHITILSNILNVLLDVWFVFGGWGIPAGGIRGAAWATGLAQCGAFVAFFLLFYKKKYVPMYGVTSKSLDRALFWRCLKIGTPSSFSAFLNIAGFSWITQVIASHVNWAEFTAFGIAQSIYIVTSFVNDGVGIGVGIVCSNAIGAKSYRTVGKSIGSGIRLLWIFDLIMLCLMILAPEGLIRLVAPSNAEPEIFSLARSMLVWTWGVLVVEGLWFVLQSMLTAAGDTRFTMTIN
ncbi:MAG: MATE family efflux transporter, partial [Puniceicoccales bacterium]|nr:MATE family efflux transporter [Puniceicoccales bacterium]